MDEADTPTGDAKLGQARELERDLSRAGLSRRMFLDRLAALGVGFGVASLLGIDRAAANAPVEGAVSLQSSDPVLNDIIEEGRAAVEGEPTTVAQWGGGYGGTPGGGGGGGYGGSGGGGGYSRGYSRAYARYERAYTRYERAYARYERAYTRYERSYTRYSRMGGGGSGPYGGGGGGGGPYGGGGGGYGGSGR